jgi:membrane protein
VSVAPSVLPRYHKIGYRLREFARRLWEKCDEDDVFFMAGAIAFNVVVALVPLIILGIGVAGFVLRARFGDPTEAVVALIAENIPQAGADVDVTGLLRRLTDGLVAQRTGLTVVGAVFFVWLSTRLAGSLRIALRETFDIGRRRGIIEGKLFDLIAVLVGVLLLTLNLGVTILFAAALDLGVGLLHLGGRTLTLTELVAGQAVAFLSIWTLFLVAYRYLPARKMRWSTVVIAATFAAVAHETLKAAFSWYATEIANYGSTLGNLATGAVLVFWIYYGALVFILGGEVAQVYTMRKASRVGVVSFEDES